MKSTDDRKAAWKTWIDDVEGDKRLIELDRKFLTAYKGNLDSGTIERDDIYATQIIRKLMTTIGGQRNQ